MTKDARKESYMLVDMDGYICLFTNIRLDRDTVPSDLFCYDVRDDDGDGSFAEIQPFVMVNHWGTLISKEPIPLNQYGCYWPENEEVFLPASETLDIYRNTSLARLALPYLSDVIQKNLEGIADAVPDDLFRVMKTPFQKRSGEDQQRLEDFWCVHVEDIPVSVSSFLGMTKTEYQAWSDGLLSLDDGSYQEMQNSHFQLSPVALKVARQLLHCDGIDQNISSVAFRAHGSSIGHTAPPLLCQFFQQLPKDKECMLSSFFDSKLPNLVLYDLADEPVAVITEGEILYKEDFAQKMKASGMKAANAIWPKVWSQFSSELMHATADKTLDTLASSAVEKVHASLMQSASLDAGKLKPALADTLCHAQSCASGSTQDHCTREELEL